MKVKVTLPCPSLCDPMDYTVHGNLQARILEWVAFPFSRGSSQPKPRSPTLQADSLPAEPQGKPKNTGVGSLCLLQGSPPPRNWTGVSCIAGGFFTNELHIMSLFSRLAQVALHSLHWIPSGKKKKKIGSCMTNWDLGSKIKKHHFCTFIWIKTGTRITRMYGVGLEMPLNLEMHTYLAFHDPGLVFLTSSQPFPRIHWSLSHHPSL